MRKLEDQQIHQKGRQDASAWVSEMKEKDKNKNSVEPIRNTFKY